MYEVIGDSKKFIFQTKLTQETQNEDGRNGYMFNDVVLNTDVFENENVTTKKIEFEVVRFKQEKGLKKTTKIIGKRRLRLKNIMELRENKAFNIDILDNKGKNIGQLTFHSPSIKPIFTFLDYKVNLNVNIIPVIVIDYSLSNLTFQEDNECIHTLKEGCENLYILALENIVKS